jgi:flagellar protein FlgJ
MDKNVSFQLRAIAPVNPFDNNPKAGLALKGAKKLSSDRSDPQLRAACMEMESLFVNYLLKEMRATIDKSGFISGGRAEEIFTSMLDIELSRRISTARGIGLSTILLEQLGGEKGAATGPEQQGGGSDLTGLY